jgi:hypothetical protein
LAVIAAIGYAIIYAAAVFLLGVAGFACLIAYAVLLSTTTRFTKPDTGSRWSRDTKRRSNG